PVQNRWVGTFDTSLIGPGIHVVIVNASNPFFDDASCTFLVTISFRDNDLIIDNPTTEIGLGDTYLATFRYSDFYGVGIPGADVSIDFTGTTDGITWSELNDLGGGNYSIEFTAVHSDNYIITISASKTYYQESEDALFIQVGEKTTSLSLENGTAAFISYGEQYRLVVRYTNGSSYGLENASVRIQSTIPETGISYSPSFTDEGDGYYSILLTPTATTTYVLYINASLSDHRPWFISFTLAVTTIGSQLSVELTQDIIYVNQTSIVTLNFTSDIYGGLDGATISPYNPHSVLNFSAVTPLGSGLYSIEVASITPGSYQIVFTAHAPNHNNATTTIILTVIRTPTQLRIAGGTNSASIGFSQSFGLLVFYERIDGSPLNITLGLLQLNFTSYDTLNYSITPLAQGYLIQFLNTEIGYYEFIITATKAGYQSDAVQFTLFIRERAMRVVMSTPIWVQSAELNITLQLVEDDTGNPVTGAEVSFKLYRLLDV
ncbi:MAG: hypothetical protein IH631_08345, partial [Candidatus Thorarchaeota archaeon]|nr:hypothetical protein [Candidatus Thorarchaeota archaeon]